MESGTKDFIKNKLPLIVAVFIAVSGLISAGVYYLGA